jgi:hypothetical protein
MGGGRIPGPLDGKAEPIDAGTRNRQASPPPGPLRVLRHRYSEPWENSFNRKLSEIDHRLGEGAGSYAPQPTSSEDESSFGGLRLPGFSQVYLLPNPNFQATPWEQAFGLTYARSYPKSAPIVNASNEVVGHLAYFVNNQILVPKRFSGLRLRDVVGSGMPAFVRSKNPDQSFWQESSPPQAGYSLMVTPGGEVIAALAVHSLDGLVRITNWDILKWVLEIGLDIMLIADGLILVRMAASVTRRLAVSLLSRELTERALVAADREVLEGAGKMAGEGTTLRASPPPMPKPVEAPKPLEAGNPADALQAELNTIRPNTALARDRYYLNQRRAILEKYRSLEGDEVFAEIDKARIAKGSDYYAMQGEGWMKEVRDIMDRVEAKYFPPWLKL